jgi:hypothetical protein
LVAAQRSIPVSRRSRSRWLRTDPTGRPHEIPRIDIEFSPAISDRRQAPLVLPDESASSMTSSLRSSSAITSPRGSRLPDRRHLDADLSMIWSRAEFLVLDNGFQTRLLKLVVRPAINDLADVAHVAKRLRPVSMASRRSRRSSSPTNLASGESAPLPESW